jgi:hypothetical protein
MLIRPHTLCLITTHQCTAACDNCCFSCAPHITRRIPSERLVSLIDEASELSTLRKIVFTGGECFLLGDELDSLVARARGYGLVTGCVTNGYWAISRPIAERRMGRLAQAGLEEIRFSTGSFHSRYVPVERVGNGACASVRAGLKTRISIENLYKQEFDVSSLVRNPELEHFISRRQIKIDRSVWVQNGGTGGLSQSSDQSPFVQIRKRGCSTVLQALAVTPDEMLAACCGLHLEKIPALHLGSLKHAALGKRIAEAPDDFLKIWIRVEGPERILEFVKRHAPDYQLPLAAAHPCETCLHLHQDETARQVIRDCYKEVERRIRLIYFARLASAEVGRAFRWIQSGFAT